VVAVDWHVVANVDAEEEEEEEEEEAVSACCCQHSTKMSERRVNTCAGSLT
jgi:hypothetical protein